MLSLRGLGASSLGRSAVGKSLTPNNCAYKCCCCCTSAITSGVGEAVFLARAGDCSRSERFKAQMQIQTAASPPHAIGCGQSNEVRRWLSIERKEPLAPGRVGRLTRAALAVDKISCRHSD